jgi:hypothetical protein
MFYVWIIVLYNFFHVQQATLERTYLDQNKCEIARVKLGYAQISPLGVHGECKMVAVPAPAVGSTPTPPPAAPH